MTTGGAAESSAGGLILITEVARDDEWLDRLRALAPGFEIAWSERPTGDQMSRAVAIAGALAPEDLAAAPGLRWNHSWRAGVDDELFPELVDSSVELTSSTGNGAVPLAEHAMMLMLMLDRDAPRWAEAQRARTWDRYVHGELAGSTVGIIGLGQAGRDLAQKARAFHMRVLGVRARPEMPVAGVERIYGAGDLHEFLPQCDWVVVTAALTPSTRGMLDEEAFAAMKPGARFVNVSRGEIAVPDALHRALESGHLGGAGLDAHADEPLSADAPWWTMPHVIVTPHNGATSFGLRGRSREIFERNLELFARGETLESVVNKRLGY